jgi:hypothetical protein
VSEERWGRGRQRPLSGRPWAGRLVGGTRREKLVVVDSNTDGGVFLTEATVRANIVRVVMEENVVRVKIRSSVGEDGGSFGRD